MKVYAAQINPHVGAVKKNAALIADIWQKHKDHCDLVVFPELCLTGYSPEDLVLKPAFMDTCEAAVKALCDLTKTSGAALLLSTPWRTQDKLYNALLLIEGGSIKHIIPKHHLPNYGVFDEKRVFAQGPIPQPVLFRGERIGFMTCEDLWLPDIAAALAAAGAAMLIVPNGSPYEEDKTTIRLTLAYERVKETGLPLLYLNQVGGQDELVYDGCSFAMNAKGAVAMTMKAFAEDGAMLTFENGVWTSDKHEDWPEGSESVYGALKLGLHDYVTKNGFTGVLLGLSGGVDSALVAVIATEALGADKVTCVMMPSPYTAQMSLDDAEQLSKNLGCPYRVISIEDGMKAFDAMLKDDAQKGVTPENIQSRLRGMILMALSNASGRMVLSTGNKSEMAVGYATLYGDMCGGFSVLKDVYKTQVYDICHWLNGRAQLALIPERILTRAPSAELKPDQTDQDSLPPYDELDAILKGLIEDDLRRRELVARGYDAATIQKVWLLLDRAEYKRRQAPPGVKITPRAFGRDRRVPITNGFVPEKLEEKR
ncbi:MAG: NAD+ synthase [Proteobacteria bacterium]|nr:NAD+ synthase [Pseudomonadota bacterium]